MTKGNHLGRGCVLTVPLLGPHAGVEHSLERYYYSNGSRAMAAEDRQHDRYHEARSRFDELDVEEQASFLVEATASTLAHGLEEAGRALAGSLQELARQARKSSTQARSSSTRPGAAEPETAQRQTSHNGTSSTE